MKLRYSSHCLKTQKDVRQLYLGEALRADTPELRNLLEELTEVELEQDGLNAQARLKQLLALELIHRGYLVPRELPSFEEFTYLENLQPLKRSEISLFSFPKARLEAIPTDAQWAVLGAPWDGGAKFPGTRFGPQLVRDRSLSFTRIGNTPSSLLDLTSLTRPLENLSAFDLGDIRISGASNQKWLETVERVIQRLPQSCRPLMLGGDHSLSLASFRALRKKINKPLSFIHIDQHLDLQIGALESPCHSNFLSHVLAEYPDTEVFQLGTRRYFSWPKHSSGELSKIKRIWTDHELEEKSLAKIFSALTPAYPVYVSLDVDVLSEAWISKTGYPAARGISFQKLQAILSGIASRFQVVGLDFMEFGSSAEQSTHRQGAELICLLLLEFLHA